MDQEWQSISRAQPLVPTNDERVSRDLPPVGRGRHPLDGSLDDVTTRIIETIGLPAVNQDHVRTAIEDAVLSLAPMFLVAERNSVYGEEDWSRNSTYRGTTEAAPLRVRAVDPAEATVVAWQYNAIHANPYGNIQATQREVTFEGVTIVNNDGTVTRYVDWLFVMAQLGIVGTQRPLLAADPAADGTVRSMDG
jgi:hypothetical protein